MSLYKHFIALKKWQFFDQLTNANSFKELSHNLHFLIISILLIQNIFVAIFRFDNYSFVFTIVNLSEISVYIISIVLFKKRHYNASILVTAFCMPIIFAYCIFCIPVVTILSCLWFLLAFQIIYTIIINGNQHRIYYFIYCAVIFYIPGILNSGLDLTGSIIKFVQIGTLTIIPIILATFFERQDNKMLSLNKKLTLKYIETEEQAQKLSKKNSDLIVFSHIMSHDLQAPLQTIKAFNDLLEKAYKKNATADTTKVKYFKTISSSIDTMTDLIKSLLIYSKIEQKEYEFKPVDLQDLVQEVLLLFLFDIEQKKIQIEIKDLSTITCEQSLIKTVFQNLISNGIKFQPKKDEIHQPKLSIWLVEEQANYIIFFKDNGIGINPEHTEEIFTPFERFHKDYKGSGLGMSICKKIMKIHQGDIQLFDSNKHGTTFKLIFPKKLPSSKN